MHSHQPEDVPVSGSGMDIITLILWEGVADKTSELVWWCSKGAAGGAGVDMRLASGHSLNFI